MTTFWWVRHGPTHQKTFTGWRDVPADLSDTDALARLDAYLPSNALIISSDLIRSRTTADAIQGQRTRLPDDAGLREFDFGAWDGLHFTEVADRWPELSRAYWEQPGDLAPPNGESWNAAEKRINAARTRLEDHKAEHVIVVAHFGAILTQIRVAAKHSAYEALSHKIDTLSVTCIPPDSPATVINHCP